MGESRSSGSGSVSVDVERISFGGKDHLVRTRCGSVSVAVYGDQEKPALITYPDVALNYMSCFQGLFLCPEAASLLLHNFCVYHINPQGHEFGAAPVQSDVPVPCVDDLADQLLDERQGENVWRLLQSMNKRHDLTDKLRKLRCRTLVFVGESSQFHDDAIHMTTKLDRRYCALVEVQNCGSLVTEEQPYAMLMPMEYFLMGYGLHRPYQPSSSPRSPLSPCRISPDLLSPESMGVKLKPIKTRITVHF